jgi:hypothetical protein
MRTQNIQPIATVFNHYHIVKVSYVPDIAWKYHIHFTKSLQAKLEYI